MFGQRFYHRTAEHYRPVRDEWTLTTSFKKLDTFKCALQNLYWDEQWERWGKEYDRVYRTYRFFSDYLDVQIWDKLVIDWVDYIVNSSNVYQWLLRTFCKWYLIKWEWT